MDYDALGLDKEHPIRAKEYAVGSTESKQELAIVPPNSTVTYEIELVSFVKKIEVDGKKKEEGNVLFKAEVDGKKKEEGNVLFKAGKYLKASKRYEKAAKYIEYDTNFDEADKQHKQYEVQQNQYLIDQKLKEHLGQAVAF
ncbi:rotamase FKBP 1 [Artemisia annua]|uniref:Rotamase FKBP 1 n=1 Tax=Artemisia annua TaxID=35608 RepID=A0A2U1N8A6_ARTAN|nr:rotamase FKBP 1 [Artemisia annua]